MQNPKQSLRLRLAHGSEALATSEASVSGLKTRRPQSETYKQQRTNHNATNGNATPPLETSSRDAGKKGGMKTLELKPTDKQISGPIPASLNSRFEATHVGFVLR